MYLWTALGRTIRFRCIKHSAFVCRPFVQARAKLNLANWVLQVDFSSGNKVLNKVKAAELIDDALRQQSEGDEPKSSKHSTHGTHGTGRRCAVHSLMLFWDPHSCECAVARCPRYPALGCGVGAGVGALGQVPMGYFGSRVPLPGRWGRWW